MESQRYKLSLSLLTDGGINYYMGGSERLPWEIGIKDCTTTTATTTSTAVHSPAVTTTSTKGPSSGNNAAQLLHATVLLLMISLMSGRVLQKEY